jgi:hypothetical protein
MSCTNPNCECKPGTFANLNPPTKAQTFVTSTQAWFTRDMFPLDWQEFINIRTASGKYRVEITWALDRYRVSVYRRVQEPEKLVRVHHPHFAHTAVKTANALLRYYEQNGY